MDRTIQANGRTRENVGIDGQNSAGPELFKLEKVLGCTVGDRLRDSFGNLQLAIEGVVNVMGVHNEDAYACAIQRIFQEFEQSLTPILNGEVAMKGRGV